jgi:glycosyl transferase family 2
MPNLTAKPTVSIVVPFHNEEDNITELYARLHSAMEEVEWEYQLVFVDDGSTDQLSVSHSNQSLGRFRFLDRAPPYRCSRHLTIGWFCAPAFPRLNNYRPGSPISVGEALSLQSVSQITV